MRKRLLLIIFATFSTLTFAQIKIPNTNVEFQFPNNNWKYLQTTNVDKNTTVYLYACPARITVDAEGDTTLPFLRIYVVKSYNKSVYELAYDRYMQQPFQSLDEYTEGVPSEGIGYLGAYTNSQEEKDYEFRMIYFKDRSTAVEFRLETSLDNFSQEDAEFKSIIESVKIVK